jgi:hypothetical protein
MDCHGIPSSIIRLCLTQKSLIPPASSKALSTQSRLFPSPRQGPRSSRR